MTGFWPKKAQKQLQGLHTLFAPHDRFWPKKLAPKTAKQGQKHSKTPLNDAKTMPKRPQNDAKMIPK